MRISDKYRKTLGAVRDYLASFEDTVWLPRLEMWVSELDTIRTVGDLRAHLAQTRSAMNGMGSLGDFSITPQAGHTIDDDRKKIGAASRRLWELTGELYREAQALFRELGEKNNRELVDS